MLKQGASRLEEVNHVLLGGYNADQPVPAWVPYPVCYRSFTKLVEQVGYKTIYKLQERPSIYGRATLYNALAVRRNTR